MTPLRHPPKYYVPMPQIAAMAEAGAGIRSPTLLIVFYAVAGICEDVMSGCTSQHHDSERPWKLKPA